MRTNKNPSGNRYKNLNLDNPRHAKIFRFIDEYGIDLNGTQAAIRAGYSARTANEQSSQLLANLNIKKLIDEKLAEIAKRNGIKQDDVVQRWKLILETDVRDYVTLRRTCCRFCHSDGFLYQFTPHEFKEAEKAHIENEANKKLINPSYVEQPFDEEGGTGYIANKKPHPDCPECFGEGIANIYFKNIDLLPDAFIFKGAKNSKGDIELVLADKEKALEALSRYVGLYDKDNKLTFQTPDNSVLSTYWETMERARARQEAIDKERGNIVTET